MKSIDTVPIDIDPITFFNNFVRARKPVILDGHPTSFEKWTDTGYLVHKAGDIELTIEPLHKELKQFGSGAKRTKMNFADFLSRLQNSEDVYLTTQYEEEEDADNKDAPLVVFSPPLHKFKDDFPSAPRPMGHLALQQVNLWMGAAKDGASSGLHHDQADNLYCLIQGRKRFLLFPPKSVSNLYPHGTLDRLHFNGTISYKESPVRADGLDPVFAARTKVDLIQSEIDGLRQNEEINAVLLEEKANLLEEAEEEMMSAMMEQGEENGDDFDDLGDSNDESMEGDTRSDKTKISAHTDIDTEQHPPSFSQIKVAELHAHLGINTPQKKAKQFPLLSKAKPLVVELQAGQSLYLPASWFHEVTSFSSESSRTHMAFNYWFFPPDGREYDQPYVDKILWDHLKTQQDRAEDTSSGSLKRKHSHLADGDDQIKNTAKKR